MEFLGLILLIVAGVILVLPIAAIVTARNAARTTREELDALYGRMRDLESQLQRLVAQRADRAESPAAVEAVEERVPAGLTPVFEPEEMQLSSAGLVRPPGIAAFEAPATPVEPVRIVTPVTPVVEEEFMPWAEASVASEPIEPEPEKQVEMPPIFAASSAEQQETLAERSFSLEQRLGANWLNKLGIAILVVGLAFFLAFKLQTMGPAGKVLCGFAVALTLLGGGVWLERKETYRIFARAGIGGGWALAFFTTFAMHHLSAARVIQSLTADLVLMLLVAAGMVAHSLRYRSQTVTGLAFLLGFATLFTSHMEAANGTVVFSLSASAVLALGLVVVTRLRHWAWLEVAGVVAGYATHWLWLSQVLPENHAAFAEFWPSTVLILLYWLIFRAAYVWRTPLDQREENLSSLAATLNSGGVLGLLKFQSAHPEWAFWALLALGAIEMWLAFVVRTRRRQAFVVLSTIATVLLVSAVPFKFHGVSWPMLWLVEAQLLAICGLRLGEPVFRRLGLLAGVLTGGVLAFSDVAPLVPFRLDYPDPARHVSLTAALTLAAILYWIHGEVYPRRWPWITENGLEALALGVTSWFGAAAAGAALWVALPDLWLPIGWLALVLVLAYVAQRLRAVRPALQADVLVVASVVALVLDHVYPLALFRLSNPDAGRHAAETIVLALAAVAFWIISEVYPRVLPALEPTANFDLKGWQGVMRPTSSWLGLAAAASALWIVLPAQWVAVGCLALVILLGLAADWLKAVLQAAQADVLALAAGVGLFSWNVYNADKGWWNYDAPLFAAVVLLYVCMRRKTAAAGTGAYVAQTHSWAATLVLAFAAMDASSNAMLTLVWSVLGVALFEIGRWGRKGYLRWQGLFLVALAFARYLLVNLPSAGPAALINLSPAGNLVEYPAPFSWINSLLLEVLILVAAGLWLLERTRNKECCTQRERFVGVTANVLGTISLAAWFAYRFPSSWVPATASEAWVTAIWAGMAALLLSLAWLAKRRAFHVQALAMVAAVLVRALFIDLPANTPEGFWNGTLLHLGVVALILLAALPFAFMLRGEDLLTGAALRLPPELGLILKHPEQWFFFTAFAIEMVALAFKLSSGHITIAWSLLGLGVFLFALAVGERSFRLAGLGLLLLSVAKILLMDVWALSPSDRYTTLIVLGLALLAVSFLYTRFSAVIRRYL